MSQFFFPLYRLPHLVRHEVMKAMDPLELLILSKTSHKSFDLVKSATKKYQLHIFMIAKQEENSVIFSLGGQGGEIKIEPCNETCGLVGQCISDDKSTVPRNIQYNEDNLIIYGNDKVKGFTKAIELLAHTFNANHVEFKFDNQLQSTIKQLLACTKMHRLKTRHLFISGAGIPINCAFNLMLEESRHALKLYILVKPFYRLGINDPANFTVGTTQEMNSFLKKWKLEKWVLRSIALSLYDNFDLRMAVEGLNGEIAKEVKMENGKNLMLQPGEGYTIQRNDGVKATVSYVDKHFIMKIDH